MDWNADGFKGPNKFNNEHTASMRAIRRTQRKRRFVFRFHLETGVPSFTSKLSYTF